MKTLLFLLLSLLCLADPNLAEFVAGWLQPVTVWIFDSQNFAESRGIYDFQFPSEKVRFEFTDPNQVKVGYVRPKYTLKDFADFARTYQPPPKPVITYYIAPRLHDSIKHDITAFQRGGHLWGYQKAVADPNYQPCEICLYELYLEWWMNEELKRQPDP